MKHIRLFKTLAAYESYIAGGNIDYPLVAVTDAEGVVKIIPTPIIKFTIKNVEYSAKADMTWGAWVDSKYNTSGFVAGKDYDIAVRPSTSSGNMVCTSNGNPVDYRDVIIEGHNYIYKQGINIET
jgi:hypothetical protein